jgi:hypothetical protein
MEKINMSDFEEIVDQLGLEEGYEIVEDDMVDCEDDEVIKSGYMSFIKQYTKDGSKKSVAKNQATGWSNPVLSDGLTMNEEAVVYRETSEQIQKVIDTKGDEIFVPDSLSYKLDRTFRKVAGYYANYENKWYNEMRALFPDRDNFIDFYYDLLRECLLKYDINKKSDNVYKNDYRKAKSTNCHFNQYFFGALGKRKITELKKRSNAKKNPSVECKICGQKTGKITNFHLRHSYDIQRVKKDFGVSPIDVITDGKKVKIYEKCPFTGKENVLASSVKEHSYAESMTVEDYMHKFPNASLSGAMYSLHAPLDSTADGVRTFEDVYVESNVCPNLNHEFNNFSDHIDHVFKDAPLTAEILKLKMMDYKNGEIAEMIGEEITLYCPISDNTQEMAKKSQLAEYFRANADLLGSEEYFESHKTFYILSREVIGSGKESWEAITITSCSAIKVSQILSKLKEDKLKQRELFEGRKL